MSAEFHDLQDKSNPLNGMRIVDTERLLAILDGLQKRKPFLCELESDNGYQLTVGIGGSVGCVQHSPSDGDIPYLMAVAPGEQDKDDYVEFLLGNTPTPVSRRYCLPFEMVKQILAYFLETDQRWPHVVWEEI